MTPKQEFFDRADLPRAQYDALLDFIYEHGTASEGIAPLALKLCQAYRNTQARDAFLSILADCSWGDDDCVVGLTADHLSDIAKVYGWSSLTEAHAAYMAELKREEAITERMEIDRENLEADE